MSEQGTTGDGSNGHDSDATRDDWHRYGGAGHRGTTASAHTAHALGDVDDLGRLRDELYLDYRREGAGSRHRTPEQEAARRRRRTANIVGLAAAAAVVGAAAVVFNIQASTFVALPTPSRFAPSTPTEVASTAPSGSFAPPFQATMVAHVGVTIQMPLAVTIPDRGLDPDDGTTMYLTGNTGGFAMDPGTGRVLRVLAGAAFVRGMQRAVVDQSLWLSTWPSETAVCGPACWADATTYQVDLSTGKLLATLDRSFLVGATSAGVWVATGSNVERLDPRSAAIGAVTPWSGTAEPRVGCDNLWSYQLARQASVNLIDPASGAKINGSLLTADYTFGPITSDGQCWMMTGTAGSSNRTTKLAWLNPDGSTYAERSYGQSMVVLDQEFWTYSTDGTMQRFEAASGNPYGVRYKLPVRPSDGDPRWFFASTGTLWLTLGDSLVGFDVDTGASAVRI